LDLGLKKISFLKEKRAFCPQDDRMTEIKPFSAVFYNKDKVHDLDSVMCPPYDVISPEQQKAYYKLSDKNFIRVLLAQQKSTDTENDNRYTRAKATYDQWLKDGTLVQDDRPCIYFYRQEYKVLGTRHSRLGFISLMKIQDEEGAKIYPHEKTHAAAKEDRYKLWNAVNSCLSPIFVCFSDREKKVEKIFVGDVSKTAPFMDILDQDGVRHIVWRLEDDKLIKSIVDVLQDQPVFIADGHHRYEVARQIRNARMSRSGKKNGAEPYNYLMTYFTNMDSRDLQIFPMHRIVKKFPDDLAFLEEFFRVDRVKKPEDLVVLAAKAGHNEHAFGLYMKNNMCLLRLKNKLLIDKMVKEGSPEYKRLDAAILKAFVFDQIGIPSEDITYTKDMNDIIRMVDSGEAKAGFVMNPVRIQQLKSVALNGEKMPPKTTYFYPKLLSGLTIYRFDS